MDAIESAGFDAHIVGTQASAVKVSLRKLTGMSKPQQQYCHPKWTVLPAVVQVVKMQVSGMTCSACSSAVEKSLQNLSGVQSASVSLSLQQADVQIISEGAEEVSACSTIQVVGVIPHDTRRLPLSNFICDCWNSLVLSFFAEHPGSVVMHTGPFRH